MLLCSICMMGLLSACSEDMTLPGKPIGYYKLTDSFEMKTDANGNPRDMHIFWITPTTHSEKVTYADLISTVMTAADKYYKEKENVPIIKVFMRMDEQTAQFYDPTIASITYIPDKKGIDGVSESPVWNDAVARQRGFSSDEVDYLLIFDEIALKYNSAEELRAEIANRMGKRLNSNPSENVLLNLKISDQNTIIEK